MNKTYYLFIAFSVCIIAAVIFASRGTDMSLSLSRLTPSSDSPLSTSTSDLPVLADSMPDFLGITRWWNTPENKPLTKDDLKGKVVLVDFWTYSCINCIRTQPTLRAWWDTYQKNDFVMVGVHTPEFAFEKDPKNVEAAIERAHLAFPVALDADYATWNAYRNRYWPATYLFDREGRLRYRHFGEGNYEETEQAVRELLAEKESTLPSPTEEQTVPNFESIKTPETYVGYARAEGFANEKELKKDATHEYDLQAPAANEWSLGGAWKIEREQATAQASPAVFRMNVEADAMHLVLGSTNGPQYLILLVDGKPPTDEMLTSSTRREADGSVRITVDRKDLYRIAKFPDEKRHAIELAIPHGSIEFYAATFGE